MTDTISPITEPHLTPMFATGAQPLAPTTQPHPSPIFDTGPHPEPLRLLGDALEIRHAPGTPEASAAIVVSAVDEPALAVEPGPSVEPAPLVEPALSVGPLSEPLAEAPVPQAFSELDNVDTDAFLRSMHGQADPLALQAQPVVVPSSYQFVKRWKFALMVAGVWLLSAAAGLGFYYWWYTSLSKTIPVFGILLYLVVCMVASILVSMIPNRPQVTALAIAMMAAPLASTAAAAVLHGAYFFEWIARPVMG